MGKRIQIEPKVANSYFEQGLTAEAVVVEVGTECTFVKKGDSIIFLTWAVDSVEINDKKLYFIKESDDVILAKCGKTPNALMDTSTITASNVKQTKQLKKSVGGAKTGSSSK